MKRPFAWMLLVATAALLSSACDAVKQVSSLVSGSSAKAGEPCAKAGESACLDDKNAVLCVGGKWEQVACRGLNGCMGIAPNVACTNDGYAEGEPCLEEGNYQCTVDKKGLLGCEKNHWKTVEKCLGQNGCVANAKGAKCDNSISEAGAPCQQENTYACGTDGKTLLRCTQKKLVPSATCPGRYGCRRQFEKIECNGEIPIGK